MNQKMSIGIECPNNDAQCSFKALFFWANFPGPMFIPCPTSIPDSRVKGMAEGLKIRRGEKKCGGHNLPN